MPMPGEAEAISALLDDTASNHHLSVPRSLLCQNANFFRQFNAICPVQSLSKKQFPSRSPQISTRNPAVSSLTRGGSRSSRTRGGMRWTRQRQAREVVRRAVIRERARRAGRTALKRTAKPCGPDTRGWCQAAGGEFDPTGSISPSSRQRRRQDEFVSGESAA
jgi:hypothetical protein